MLSPGRFQATYQLLAVAGCVAAGEETEELLADAHDDATLEAWVSRREEGEPLAWITGHVEFLGQRLHIDQGVYVPRKQSEGLAVRAAGLLPDHGRAADLCTGAGAIAAHLTRSKPRAAVVATDVDRRAVACARHNGVAAVVADLDRGLGGDAFDVVTAVPPYVPTAEMRLLPSDVVRYEPHTALDGGPDGLDVVRRLVVGAARLLRPGGWLLIEIGGDQGALIEPDVAAAGFDALAFLYDEDDDLRGMAAQMRGPASDRR